jgi:hypothetical protein
MAAQLTVELHGPFSHDRDQSTVQSSSVQCVMLTICTLFHDYAGKKYTQRVPPMAPLGNVIPAVLSQARLKEPILPETCVLLHDGKPLDLATPVR